MVWKQVKGKFGRMWFVPQGETPDVACQNIWVKLPKQPFPPPFEGCGGATVEFLLDDGSTVSVQGPWNSNTEALKDDTGIQV